MKFKQADADENLSTNLIPARGLKREISLRSYAHVLWPFHELNPRKGTET